MEMQSDHNHLRWESRGRRSKRPWVDDELAAAEALILLANCDGGFCPRFPKPAKIFFTSSVPATSSIPHPNSLAASVSAATPAAVNARIQEPCTPLMSTSPQKNHQQQPPSGSAAVNVKNQDSSSPISPAASATTAPAVNIKNQEPWSPNSPLMSTSSKKHHQQQSPSGSTDTASAATPAAAVRVKNQDSSSPDTPIMAVAHHDCWVCGKRFRTHQALGGHMTGHRVQPQSTTVSDDRGDSVKKGGVHECSCCHEIFSTGQALGGHKRKHYDRALLPRKSAIRRSISFDTGRDDGGGGATTLVSRPNIDLNMPPPPEE